MHAAHYHVPGPVYDPDPDPDPGLMLCICILSLLSVYLSGYSLTLSVHLSGYNLTSGPVSCHLYLVLLSGQMFLIWSLVLSLIHI